MSEQGPPAIPPTGEFEDSASGLAVPRHYDEGLVRPGGAAAVADRTVASSKQEVKPPSIDDIDFSDAPQETVLTGLDDTVALAGEGFDHPVYSHTYERAIEWQDPTKTDTMDWRLPYTMMRYGQPGDAMKLGESKHANHPDREIIMHAEGDDGAERAWLIKGDQVFTIKRGRIPPVKIEGMNDRSDNGPAEPTLELSTLEDGADLPQMAIGDEMDLGAEGKFKLKSVQLKAEEGFHVPSGRPDMEKLKSDPFEVMEQLIVGLDQKQKGLLSENTVKALDGRITAKAFDEAFDWEEKFADKPDQEIDPASVPDRIEAFAENFKDPLYVPTPDEFQEMQRLKEMLTNNDDDGTGTMRLSIAGTRIDPQTMDTFLDKSKAENWELTDFQIKTYDKGLAAGAPMLEHKVIFLKRNALGKDSVLTVGEFRPIRKGQLKREDAARARRGEAHVKSFNEQSLMRDYSKYVSSRTALAKNINAEKKKHQPQVAVELAEKAARKKAAREQAEEPPTEVMDTDEPDTEVINHQLDGMPYDWQKEPDLAIELGGPGAETELEVPDFVTANDIAFRALADYRKWQSENTLNKQAGRALNRGLDRAHHGSMQVDKAVRGKMDQAALKAAQARDKAREFKELWNQSAVNPLDQMSENTPQEEALKDYVRWQRREHSRTRPSARATRAVRKTAQAAAKLRRRSRS